MLRWEQPAVLQIVSFTTLFPNRVRQNHGVFVENRLRHLVAADQVEARVLAPTSWYPFGSSLLPRYGHFSSIPARETRHDIEIRHPRFLTIPKLGMSLAPALLYAGSLSTLRQMQQEQDFHLIDAHYFYPDGVAAAWLGKRLRKPVVITARGTDVNLIPNYALPRRMIQSAANAAAGIIAVSQALKDAMIRIGVPADKITVLRNGVDLELFHPGEREKIRRQMGLKRRLLLSVGLLIERKGHDLIIGAMPQLPDYDLLIAGEGEERGRLEALAVRLGVQDRVRLLGSVPHRELPKLYAAADALVLASSREGWPNVLLEAMACGTPVVASNIWGNPEVVGAPEAGVLMPERSAAGVAEGVRNLFAHLPDRGRTRAFAEQYSWDATTQGQIDLFRQILRQHPQSQRTEIAPALST